MSLKGLRVLIAEDEALVLMNLELMVEEAGGTVVGTARTCSQAIELAESETIDVAILDVNLADREVYEAADLLAQRQIPFAFYSGRAKRETLDRRFPRAGYLSKPSSDDEIIRTLARLNAVEQT